MAADLTVVFYTANRTSARFMANIQRLLLAAIGDLPLISVSQQPMPGFGENICVGAIGQSYLNIYRQQLIGARACRTKYLALTEDDILFPPSHFTCFRPPDDAAGYDLHKWQIFTWKNPPFFCRNEGQRWTTGCIAPTTLVVEALEERFAKYPRDKYPNDAGIPLHNWGEIGRYEARLGVTVRKTVRFDAPDPHVIFIHEAAVGFQYLGKRKRPLAIQVTEIPYWGQAQDVMRLHHD